MGVCRCSEPRPNATSQHQHRLLSTLARHGRFAAAATLFYTVHRTTGVLNAILVALCCSSRSSPTLLRAAPAVLLHAAPHAALDIATSRILTAALCRVSQPSAAADLLRCMLPLLLDPDPCHCRAVLASLCRRGAPARDALTFLDDMRRPRAEGRRAGGRPERDGFAAGGRIAAVAACTELSRAGVAVGGRADLAGHGGRAVAAGFAGAGLRA
jgi:hypothetical protein